MSRLRYSEQGLLAVIRPVSRLVCQLLIVSSYCRPGSAQPQAAPAILRNSPLGVDRLDGLASEPRVEAELLAVLDRVHELVADADGVIGVLVLDGDDVRAAQVHVKAGVAQRADLVLFFALVSTKSTMPGFPRLVSIEGSVLLRVDQSRQPVIPSSAVPSGRQFARAAGRRPLPLARPVPAPPAPEDVVYGIGRIDSSGRIADRTVTTALGWADGDRLILTAEAGVATSPPRRRRGRLYGLAFVLAAAAVC